MVNGKESKRSGIGGIGIFDLKFNSWCSWDLFKNNEVDLCGKCRGKFGEYYLLQKDCEKKTVKYFNQENLNFS